MSGRRSVGLKEDGVRAVTIELDDSKETHNPSKTELKGKEAVVEGLGKNLYPGGAVRSSQQVKFLTETSDTTVSYDRIEFGEVRFTGKPIRTETDSDEQKYLVAEIEKFMPKLPELTQGATMAGKSISSLVRSIRDVFGLAVEIDNFLKSDIGPMEHSFNDRSCHGLPETIKAGTSEALIFSSRTYLSGILSYPMPTIGLRLVVSLNQNKEMQLAVALAPLDLPPPVEHKQLEGVQVNIRRFTNTSSGTNDIMYGVARVGSIRACIRLFYFGAKSTLQIRIVDVRRRRLNPNDRNSMMSQLPTSPLKLVNDQTVHWKIDRVFEQILHNYGYVLEITNLLVETLNRPKCYMETVQVPLRGPQLIGSNCRGMAILQANSSGAGSACMVTYRIGPADLRLAVAFQLFNNGNKVAIAFLPTSAPTDAAFFKVLFNDNQWKISPDIKFAQAKDGEIVIETRNIRARAIMTDSMKSLISIVIKTI